MCNDRSSRTTRSLQYNSSRSELKGGSELTWGLKEYCRLKSPDSTNEKCLQILQFTQEFVQRKLGTVLVLFKCLELVPKSESLDESAQTCRFLPPSVPERLE
jgi:hypothetical protein